MVVENRKAIQISPPAIRRDSSAVGSTVKLKMTTTSPAKNSMEFSTSRERHSRRRSLRTLLAVNLAMDKLMNAFSCLDPGHGAAIHQLAGGEKEIFVRHAGQQSQLMGHKENGGAPGAHRGEEPRNLRRRFRIDVGKRLIEEQQLR